LYKSYYINMCLDLGQYQKRDRNDPGNTDTLLAASEREGRHFISVI
jgi:hypothetical protein